MDENAEILKFIRWYARQFSDIKLFRKMEFNQQSYSRWAVKELYRYVSGHPEKHAYDSIHDFLAKMEEFCFIPSDNSIIFAVAVDVIKDIEDQLLIFD